MGAWMTSTTTGDRYLTGEFTQRKISKDDFPTADRISRALGFESTKVESQVILDELARVEENRALLIKEIADTVLAGIADGVTATVEVDPAAIALAVEQQLADEFAQVNANIDDQPTEFTITPKE